MKKDKIALLIMLFISSPMTLTANAEEGAVAIKKGDASIIDTHSTIAAAGSGQTVETSPVVLKTSKPKADEIASFGETQLPAKKFTAEQEAEIGQVASRYFMEHPEILVEVSKNLEAQQQAQQIKSMTQAVLRHQEALLDDKSTPSYGPVDAKVALIEFFDYQCSVCAHQAPIIQSLMKSNPQVRYVFKEWPIFAQRWTASLTAAKTGLQVWEQKGPDAYLTYHNALYATGHDEGRLTQADINKAAAQAGKLKGKKDEMLEVLSRNDALAQNLGLRGTPGIIVMPLNGATADNVTVILGGAEQSLLQAAIDKAADQVEH